MQYVYVLFHPITELVAYVGITDNPGRRYKEHCRVKASDSGAKDIWIRGLKKDNLLPGMKIVECIEIDEQARERELYWIQFYSNLGMKLLNVINNHNAIGLPPKELLPERISQLGILIQKAADMKNCTLRGLAKLAGTTEPHLSRIVRGKSQPSREMLIKICKALGCTLEETARIFAESDWRKPAPEELSIDAPESSPQDRVKVA